MRLIEAEKIRIVTGAGARKEIKGLIGNPKKKNKDG
jgi:hypothetical protein